MSAVHRSTCRSTATTKSSSRAASAIAESSAPKRTKKRLTSRRRDDRGARHRGALDDPDLRPVRLLVPPGASSCRPPAGGRSSRTRASRFDNYSDVLAAGNGAAEPRPVVRQLAGHHDPGDGLPARDRDARGLRVRVDRVQGQGLAVHRGVRAADRADPDGAGAAAAACSRADSRSATSSCSRGLGTVDGSYAQVWIAHTIFALPLAIFLLHNFIAEIPGELIEAARVDGAGHGQIFFRIVLPLTHAGDRVVRDLPVPLGLERPAGGADLRRAARSHR